VQINSDQCDADRELTAEELRWLAEWVDEQLSPEAVTVAQANAALAARRSQSSSSQAGTSQAAG